MKNISDIGWIMIFMVLVPIGLGLMMFFTSRAEKPYMMEQNGIVVLCEHPKNKWECNPVEDK